MGNSVYGNRHGYTLIEMVVVIAIFSLVLVGIYMTFESARKEYGVRQSTIRMQQQARLAMMSLERDLKIIGYGFIDLGSLQVNVYSGGSPATWSMVSATDNTIDATINNRANTDTIQLRYYDGALDVNPDVTITGDHSDSSDNTPVSSISGFNSGDFFIIYDPSDPTKPASMLRMTGSDSAAGLAIRHAHGDYPDVNPPGGNNIFPSGGYGPGCKVLNLGQGRFRMIRYFIDGNFNLVKQTRDDPSRAVVNHIVAAGVEDLQIKYQFKGNATWYNYGQTGMPSISDLRAVRISIIVRAQNIDRSFRSTTAYQLTGDSGNGAVHAGGDGFRRMIMSTVIYLRNMGIRG